MKYYLKENLRFLYADGQLYDEAGNEVYYYENRTLFYPRIDLYKYGVNIGHVQSRFSWLLARFDLVYGSDTVGSLNEELSFIRSSLHIDGLGWRVEGDIFAMHYQIFNEEDEVIAYVDQEIFHLTQHFYVDICDEDNEELIVLLVLAINQFDKQRQAAASASVSNH